MVMVGWQFAVVSLFRRGDETPNRTVEVVP
jgi:hypothetical protein